MNEIKTIAADAGYPLALAHHTFRVGPQGELQHFISDELRATVPPEGWEEYARTWPQVRELVDELRRGKQSGAGADGLTREQLAAADRTRDAAAAADAQRALDAAAERERVAAERARRESFLAAEAATRSAGS